jgi:hypothetical protein
MYVALLANTAWLDEDLAVFRHLVVGLIDEQVRVVQVVPGRLSEEESVAFGQRLTWTDSTWTFLRRRRLARLATPLAEMGVTVVHALDGRMWPGAYDLAQALDCAAVFTANSHFDVPQARRFARQLDASRMAFAPTTAPLAKALRDEAPPAIHIEVIAPGVSVPEINVEQQRAADAAASRTCCAVITGNGRYDADYEVLCAALSSILAEFPNTQF